VYVSGLGPLVGQWRQSLDVLYVHLQDTTNTSRSRQLYYRWKFYVRSRYQYVASDSATPLVVGDYVLLSRVNTRLCVRLQAC
jgi:hypothetical protein